MILKDNNISKARYFICTEADIQNRILNLYLPFMEKHNYRRPSGSKSKQAILQIKHLAEYENNWDILENLS